MMPPPPTSTLFPYTTLFRSSAQRAVPYFFFLPFAFLLLPYSQPSLRHLDCGARAVNKAKVKRDRKSTRLNSSHTVISYAVFCLKKKKKHLFLGNALSPKQIP